MSRRSWNKTAPSCCSCLHRLGPQHSRELTRSHTAATLQDFACAHLLLAAGHPLQLQHLTWRRYTSCLWSFSKTLRAVTGRSLGNMSPNPPISSLKQIFICAGGGGKEQLLPPDYLQLSFPMCRDEALTLLSLCREDSICSKEAVLI